MTGSWNDGPGATPRKRAQGGFRLKVSVEGEHWRWIGPFNFAGRPAFQMPSGAMASASLIAWELFRGKRIPTLEHVCDVEDCVRPEASHNRRPAQVKAVRP